MTAKNQILTKLTSATLAWLLVSTIAATLPAADKPEASAKDLDLKLDSNTAVVLDSARNGLPAKTKLIATATFLDYQLAPVVDGNKQRKDLPWQEAAWASEEEAHTHGIEIQLSQPQRGGRFQVTWAYDTNGSDGVAWWISRNYTIQVKAKADDEWKTAVDVKSNQSIVGSYPLPDTAFSFVRICQPTGGGHPTRPNIMWVGQLELLKD